MWGKKALLCRLTAELMQGSSMNLRQSEEEIEVKVLYVE